MKLLPIVALTMGDPCGIGPEIIVKALADPETYKLCRPIAVASPEMLEQELKICGLSMKLHEIDDPEDGLCQPGTIDVISVRCTLPEKRGMVCVEGGEAAYRCLERAINLAKGKKISAICTAPLNKEALHLAGYAFPGHTEILATLTGTTQYAMMLCSPKLNVIHLTTHKGLIDAINSITAERTENVIQMAYDALKNTGIATPRVAVAGINPHCGENGLFGHQEEEEKLIPAIERARSRGIEVTGPWPADTVYSRAVKGEFDVVIAPYHDQGHIAVKLLGFDEGVNITVGLKGGVIRTSVDHGTAFDIAGQNKANPGSMVAAIRYAALLAPKDR